jgi:hypothetical protein
MSLYDVLSRSDTTAKFLREDERLIHEIYVLISNLCETPITTTSDREQQKNLNALLDVVAEYEQTGQLYAILDGHVKDIVSMITDLEKSIDNGYIEMVTSSHLGDIPREDEHNDEDNDEEDHDDEDIPDWDNEDDDDDDGW